MEEKQFDKPEILGIFFGQQLAKMDLPEELIITLSKRGSTLEEVTFSCLDRLFALEPENEMSRGEALDALAFVTSRLEKLNFELGLKPQQSP